MSEKRRAERNGSDVPLSPFVGVIPPTRGGQGGGSISISDAGGAGATGTSIGAGGIV